MNLPSLMTMREWRFDTLPLGRMMSLPCTRPIVISTLSNCSRRDSPPFSAMVIENMPSRLLVVWVRSAAWKVGGEGGFPVGGPSDHVTGGAWRGQVGDVA